jgi:hypothetical protein
MLSLLVRHVPRRYPDLLLGRAASPPLTVGLLVDSGVGVGE